MLPLAQGSRSIKNLLIFGHCRNCLDPPTPLFSWTCTKHFFLSQKISGKMYIMSKLWQKSASKVLGLVSNSPPPFENVQIQGEKVLLTIWIWIGPLINFFKTNINIINNCVFPPPHTPPPPLIIQF